MDQLAIRYYPTSRANVTLYLMVADAITVCAAIILSLLLHEDTFSFASITPEWHRHHYSIFAAVALYLIIFALCRLYRYAWRFASLEMIWSVVYANSLGVFGLALLQAIVDHKTFNLSVLIILWLVSIVLVGGIRILLRLANMSRSYGRRALGFLRQDFRPTRVVILGGGADGARLVASLNEQTQQPYDIIGMLDNQTQRHGIYVRGVRVLGSLSYLNKLLADHSVDEVLVAMPNPGEPEIREYVMSCRKHHVPVSIIPGLQDVLDGTARPHLEEISAEDLLRRPPFRIDLPEIGKYVTGKRVLVTGAGGSIGSELCRQISALAPAELILLGHGENSIHRIHAELVRRRPELSDHLHLAIASVADTVRLDQIFATYTPQVVFHAAAHKHVPIMEANVQEAVQNNVLGTQCIAEACGRYNVERMLLISTDKAVYPTSVMGATKWLCEEVLQAMAHAYPQTRYVTVRFGNVLGSRGSVVPIFQEQIARGGPVTVTHPEVTRFFMSIPEAVQLVMQAGAIGHTGDLYLLDMGHPIHILDMARDMIRLSGLEPDVDIAITFTGMRPGERIHELLTTSEERLNPAVCEGLSVVTRPQYFTPTDFTRVLARLQQLAGGDDQHELLNYLWDIVPSNPDGTAALDTMLPGETQPVATPS